MNRVILSGDEAIARGAWEAGVSAASAYPGTPSTEILENMAQYKDDIYCTWANNEKIAAEIALGASIGGLRALAAMKHVGMNVAGDPIFSAAYTGVNGGLAIVTADDPGCHSSQNEQDNRLYAPHAKLGMLEPSDSQECKDFTKAALELSEKFDILMLIRMTTRVCHSKSIVELGERETVPVRPYESNPQKYAMLPANARVRHVKLEQNLAALKEYAYNCPFNKQEHNGGASIGVISSGICYMHAKEAFGDTVSYLKLGLSYPVSEKLITEFCAKYDKIYIVEEGEGYLEGIVKQAGVECVGKELLSPIGELDAQAVRKAFGLEIPGAYESEIAPPPRPPVLCAGCPHRGYFFSMLKRKSDIVAVGDIGCYSLGVNAPFNGFDIAICMGSGFSIPIGLSKALEKQGDKRKVFGMLGDSTFFHSGFNSLVDAVHSGANVCLCVLDNSITAMTGHQENSGTAKNLMGYQVPAIDLCEMIYSTGIDKSRVRIVDPLDLKEMDAAIDEALKTEGIYVIVTKRPCALLKDIVKARAGEHCVIDPEKCTGCKACMKAACPAMAFEDKKAKITDTANCTACGLCAQLCKFGAISKSGGAANE